MVEMIVVIMITGIVASTIGLFIGGPIQAYVDQARRGALVDGAQLALLRMGRDLRAALPNSVRISGGAIEMLNTIDGDRYRSEEPGVAADRLDFTVADDSFNTLRALDATHAAAGSTLRLAIYPLGLNSGTFPYTDASLTPATTAINVAAGTVSIGSATEYRVSLNPPHRFPSSSPGNRVFLVDGPISYLCAGGELRRHSGYAVTSAQVVPPGGTVVTIVKNVDTCAFTYSAGTAARNAVATLSITLTDKGESVRLRRQVQVDNSP